MRVSVYQNLNRGRQLREPLLGDFFERVWEGDLPIRDRTEAGMCERAFEILQKREGDARCPEAYKHTVPSLSCGHVVTLHVPKETGLHHRTCLCTSHGWFPSERPFTGQVHRWNPLGVEIDRPVPAFPERYQVDRHLAVVDWTETVKRAFREYGLPEPDNYCARDEDALNGGLSTMHLTFYDLSPSRFGAVGLALCEMFTGLSRFVTCRNDPAVACFALVFREAAREG